MKSLKERKAQREHHAAVYAGKVDDPVVSLGVDTGTYTGTDGGGEGDDDKPTDYTKLGTHADLDGDKGLAGREKPEGWDQMKVADKQAWLDANRPAPVGGW